MELFASYFIDKKTGKTKKKSSTIGMIAVYVVLLLVLSVSFYFMVAEMAKAFCGTELEWFYFAITGIISIMFGVFGSVFNTYTTLYMAKDNELLTAMPIKPAYILIPRMLGVFALGLLYESLLFVPSCIAYFLYAKPGIPAYITTILMIFVLAFFIFVLTCLLGWVVASISAKLKNKSFLTVIISLLFFGAYYYVSFNYFEIIQSIITNSEAVSESMMRIVYPVYVFGKACSGNILAFLGIILFNAVLTYLTCLILSRNFSKIITAKPASTKKVYIEKKTSQKGIDSALLRKEFKRLTTSASYMLNCCMGTLICIVVAVALVFFKDKYADIIPALDELGKDAVLFIACCICTLFASMNDTASCSLSMEGNSLWILKSMPVEPHRILFAKQKVQLYITLIPAIILCLVITAIFDVSGNNLVALFLYVCSFCLFDSEIGLLLDLKHPNLNWTSESVPLKQSLSPLIMITCGPLVSGIITLLVIHLSKFIDAYLIYIAISVIFIYSSRYINKWIMKKGSEIFREI